MASLLMLGVASGALALSLTRVALRPAHVSDALEAPQPVCNLGHIQQGGAAQAHFEIVNRSPDPIRIVHFLQNCRCVDVQLSHKELPPSERAVVDCGWDTRGLRGPSGVRLTICYANLLATGELDSEINQLDLRMQGVVVPYFSYAPAKLEFKAGRPGLGRIRIEPTKGSKDVGLLGASCSHPAFTVESSDRNSVEIAFNPEFWLDDARLFPEMTITTDCKTEPTVRIPLRILSP